MVATMAARLQKVEAQPGVVVSGLRTPKFLHRYEVRWFTHQIDGGSLVARDGACVSPDNAACVTWDLSITGISRHETAWINLHDSSGAGDTDGKRSPSRETLRCLRQKPLSGRTVQASDLVEHASTPSCPQSFNTQHSVLRTPATHDCPCTRRRYWFESPLTNVELQPFAAMDRQEPEPALTRAGSIAGCVRWGAARRTEQARSSSPTGRRELSSHSTAA